MVRIAASQQEVPGFGGALSVWDLHDSSHTTKNMHVYTPARPITKARALHLELVPGR